MHSFWGNENSSVSTVLLYSIAHSIKCDINNKNLMGAGRFFPFYNPDYSISINPDNCFTFNKGVILFGDYQFGGHRYFSNKYPGLGQFVLGPEDCSSSVGKATGLNNEQILSINTKQLKDAYKNQENQYGYQAITTNDNEQFKLEKINPGDIYVCGSYTTIIYSRDNYSNIATLGFNRDIEHPELKQLGGGTYEYNLMNIQDKQLYILRSNNCSIKEETSFYNFINKIDTAFLEQTEKDIIGDCDIYL